MTRPAPLDATVRRYGVLLTRIDRLRSRVVARLLARIDEVEQGPLRCPTPHRDPTRGTAPLRLVDGSGSGGPAPSGDTGNNETH